MNTIQSRISTAVDALQKDIVQFIQTLIRIPSLPVVFRNMLLKMGIELIEVVETEYDSLGSNVLAIAPRLCVFIEGNPLTAKRMRDAGVELHAYSGREVSLKWTGGPTCLTCPILREQG